MAIAEQFAGLQMDQLIGAPLRAAADASTLLAESTASFINKVGFNANGKVRNVAFSYEKRSVNEDGTSNLDEMKVNVPMLAIVPIPNLQVDEVNILFDMEVKQSERQESEMDLSASATASLNLGLFKVSVTGSVSAHQSNTRSSDNSAKYHVDVRATNHGMPEGLARVLDMMAANVAPSLVGTTIQDGNGQSLPEKAKNKANRLKTLRNEISQIESRLTAAEDGLKNGINQLKKLGSSQQTTYQGKIMQMINALDKDAEDRNEKETEYSRTLDDINGVWNTFQNQVGSLIEMLANENADGSAPSDEEVLKLFALKSVDANGAIGEYGDQESCYTKIMAVQKNAISSQKNVKTIEAELYEKKNEYSTACAE